MFQIKTNFHIEDYVGEYVTYSLVLGQKAFENVIVRKWDDSEFYEISTNDEEATQSLLDYSLYEFPENIEINLFCGSKDNFNLHLQFKVPSQQPSFWEDENSRRLNVDIQLIPNLESWTKMFSFIDYKNQFIENLPAYALENEDGELFQEFYISNNRYSQFSSVHLYTIHEFSKKSKIQDIYDYKRNIWDCHLTTLRHSEDAFENVILTSFNFPEELKVPCEQYLCYFATFLKDLGINATSNLEEQAGKVLFSVTPTDDLEALDKIREALAIYLSLSSNPIPHSTGDRTVDMVLSGARANAKHLESQLELAIAKLQFKEATLELKDATIEQNQLALRQRDDTINGLKEMLARGNIFEESLEKVVINGEVVEETSLYRFSREDDIEVEATPVLDEIKEETRIGVVKFHEVTKLKDYGVSLDLPKAIRNLIDYFKQDKNSR